MLNRLTSFIVLGTLCSFAFACGDAPAEEEGDEPVGATSSQLATSSFQSLASTSSRATGISGDGTVVIGSYWNATAGDHAFRWTAAGGFQDLGKLDGGQQITASGASLNGSVIVGTGYPAGSSWNKAFRWTAATGPVNMNAAGYGNEAKAVSSDGSVIVGNHTSGFRWTAASGFVNLPTNASVSDVSGDGNVVAGSTMGGANTQRAFRWTSAGLVSLGAKGTCSTKSNAPYDKITESSGNAISANGAVIVGKTTITSSSPSGTRSGCPAHAFRWTQAGGVQDLGVIGGVQSSSADDASADGAVVVGSYWAPANLRAFRWTAQTGMQDLKQVLVNLGVTSVSNWELERAVAVSHDGTVIVGYGLNKNTNRTEAFRAVIGAPAGTTCAPTTCAAQGKTCGTISDGCGGTLICGPTCTMTSPSPPTACVPRGASCTSSSVCCDGRTCRARTGGSICD